MRPFLILGFASFIGVALAQTPSPPEIPDTRRVGINIKVPSFNAARDALYAIIRERGGTILEAKSEATEKGRRHGSIIFRLPAENLEAALAEVRQLGKVTVETSTATSNAKEVEGLSARNGLLEKHHGRMESLLTSHRNLRAKDVLFIQDRLFSLEANQEGLEVQKRAILERSRSAGIAASLFEPYLPTENSPIGKGAVARFRESFTDAARDTVVSIAGFGGFLLKAIVWSPIWVTLVLLGRKYWQRAFPKEGGPAVAG